MQNLRRLWSENDTAALLKVKSMKSQNEQITECDGILEKLIDSLVRASNHIEALNSGAEQFQKTLFDVADYLRSKHRKESLHDLIERQRAEIRAVSSSISEDERTMLRSHLEAYVDEVKFELAVD